MWAAAAMPTMLGEVLAAGAQAALLAAAQEHRRDLHALAHVEGAEAARPVQIVARQAEQIDRHRARVDGHHALGGDCVAVQGDAGTVEHLGDLGDRL